MMIAAGRIGLIRHPSFDVYTDGVKIFDADGKEIVSKTSKRGSPAIALSSTATRRKDRVIAECLLGRDLQNREDIFYRNGIDGDFSPGNAWICKRDYLGNFQLYKKIAVGV
jgi:hypothetical protein